jgi:hypothetical protein
MQRKLTALCPLGHRNAAHSEIIQGLQHTVMLMGRCSCESCSKWGHIRCGNIRFGKISDYGRRQTKQLMALDIAEYTSHDIEGTQVKT